METPGLVPLPKPPLDYDIENIFKFHPPIEGQVQKYEKIREELKKVAYLIKTLCPKSREQSLAFTKLEECMFFANSAIARHEK